MRTYELPSTIPDVKMLLAVAREELRWKMGRTDGSC